MDEHVIPSKVRSERSPAYIINSVIALIIMIGFKYVVPASDPLTPLGVEILGILLGTLYGWLIVDDVIWPSIACLQRGGKTADLFCILRCDAGY